MTVVRGFWDELEYPVVGLAPMDGVTDAAFRYVVCKYSQPSLTMTEFTNVEGLARGAVKMLVAFLYNEIERPVVAQIYGVEVESYYKCAVMLCALGFDGIDINMGCPANKVAKKGSGAALIQTPELAKEIVRSCQRASKDWAEGQTMEGAGVHEDIIAKVKEMEKEGPRVELPISVKTRIGFGESVAEEWTKHLLEVEPANISMHGRTLRQMYLGKADWEELEKACKVCKESGLATTFLGNGDVTSMEDARMKCEKYGMDGVLVGRAALGSPWFFGDEEPSVEERLKTCLFHAHYFEDLDHIWFHHLRKHLAWYCKGFEGAKELRKELMKVDKAADVDAVIGNFLTNFDGEK